MAYINKTAVFYNRDRNISGFIAPDNLTDLGIDISYETSVDFSSKTFSYETSDSYFNTIPASLNNLQASYQLKYQVSEYDAQRLVNFFESKQSNIAFGFTPDANIYRTLSGYCDEYSVSHNGSYYEVSANIMVDQVPSMSNWSGMSFLNHTLTTYSKNTQYNKYDVVYIPNSGSNNSKLNNFWYCKKNNYNTLNSNASAFQLISGSFSWKSARDDAQRRNGRLAVLNTLEKSNAVPYHSGAMWIGGTDEILEGSWKWSDGSSINDYINWSNGQPNGGAEENYLQRLGYENSYQWADAQLRTTPQNEGPLLATYIAFRPYSAAEVVNGYILEYVEGAEWTQDFFFNPDIGVQNNISFQVPKVDYKSAFPLRIKTKNNIAPITISYKFTSISDKQLKSMLHFLENKAGYRKFYHSIDSVYNRPKVFYCPSWKHIFKQYNCHDLELTLIEDPLGIITNNT
jgi:phage-related protein